MPYRSSNSKSFGGNVCHWGVMGAGLEANAADLPHLEGHRIQLAGLVTEANELISEQKIQTAAKQDLSRRVEAVMAKGLRLASFLRMGVKQHYGTRSEKLTEFDLIPFRGRRQPAQPAVNQVAEAANDDRPAGK